MKATNSSTWKQKTRGPVLPQKRQGVCFLGRVFFPSNKLRSIWISRTVYTEYTWIPSSPMPLPGYSKSHTNGTHTIGKRISILHRNKTTQSTSRDVGQETKCNPHQSGGNIQKQQYNFFTLATSLFQTKIMPPKKRLIPLPLFYP